MVAKLLVTGSRHWGRDDYGAAWAIMHHHLGYIIHSLGDDTELIVGDCPTGADPMAYRIWLDRTGIQPHRFEANWKDLGNRAGPVRNGLMVAQMPDICIAFLQAGAANKGTVDCMRQAEKAGIPVVPIWSN